MVAHMALHRHHPVLTQQMDHQLLQNQLPFLLGSEGFHQKQAHITGKQMLEFHRLCQLAVWLGDLCHLFGNIKMNVCKHQRLLRIMCRISRITRAEQEAASLAHLKRHTAAHNRTFPAPDIKQIIILQRLLSFLPSPARFAYNLRQSRQDHKRGRRCMQHNIPS
ncbi:hypothetical protein D3C81_1501760 [compost metagenome]